VNDRMERVVRIIDVDDDHLTEALDACSSDEIADARELLALSIAMDEDRGRLLDMRIAFMECRYPELLEDDDGDEDSAGGGIR
jgi:hypothetical protein